MKTLARLPMALPCSHYRFDGVTHGCFIHGECKPIQQGPDLSGCKDFHNPVAMIASKMVSAPVQRPPCVHLGRWTGGVEPCKTCSGSVHLKIIECAIHGTCTIGRVVPGKMCCKTCKDYVGKNS